MSTTFVSTSEHYNLAVRQVDLLSMSTALNTNEDISAAVINAFRNTLPAVKNYFEDIIIEYKSLDETDKNVRKALVRKSDVEYISDNINMVKIGHTLIQVPEGFTDRYVPYLKWLDSKAINFINEASGFLEAYYVTLSVFISSKDAKLSIRDNTKVYTDMEKNLESAKDGLGSYFDSRSNVALRRLESLFDRGQDFVSVLKLAESLNKGRQVTKNDSILKQTKAISDLLNLIVESTENGKIPEVSAAAVTSLAKGALVAAQYVEFVGVLRYRIEEALNAFSIAIEQTNKLVKKD